MELQYDQSQLEAIELASDPRNRIVWVSGEAGVGKTTVMKAIAQNTNDQVLAMAPTGKAAKRIKEITGLPAKTAHMALEYPKPGEIDQKTGKPLSSTDPKRDHRNPFVEKVILADEYSMFNVELHRNTFDAMRPGSVIRIFGDSNQLQPIEKLKINQDRPSPFKEIMKRFPGVTLTTIHRQGEGSSIIENGRRILHGVIPKRTEDYRLHITDRPREWVMDEIMENGLYDYRSLDNQIIVPVNQGWVGTIALNQTIQGLFHDPDEPYTECDRHPWWNKDGKTKGRKEGQPGYLRLYVGDKIIFTQNNYQLGIFNGETGIVESFVEFGEIMVDFGDRRVVIPPLIQWEYKGKFVSANPQKDIELAYAITTHKAQGSEFDHVMYVMNSSRPYNLCRPNLYTGQSRARKTVDLVTDQRALNMSLARKTDVF